MSTHTHTTQQDLDYAPTGVQNLDGIEVRFDRGRVVSMSDWCRCDELVTVGLLRREHLGPATYGHVEYFANVPPTHCRRCGGYCAFDTAHPLPLCSACEAAVQQHQDADLDRWADDGGACVIEHEAPRTAAMVGYVAEARAWIADCWGDELADSLTNGEVVDGVKRHYDGGWAQFHRDAGRELAAQAVEAS